MKNENKMYSKYTRYKKMLNYYNRFKFQINKEITVGMKRHFSCQIIEPYIQLFAILKRI